MASGSIKGIKIQIEGDTSDLVKSLNDVDKKIKEDNASLKKLDQALKFDPTNVNLLAEKQRILADKTDLVTQKMGLLKQVQEGAYTAMENGAENSAAKMADLSAEIVMTNTSLNSLEAESAATDAALSGIGDSTDESANALNDLGDSAKNASGDIDDTASAADDSSDAIEALGQAAEVASKIAVTAFTTIATSAAAIGAAVAKGVSKIGSMVSDLADVGDAIDKNSQKVGLSAASYQKWDYVMNIAGADMDSMKNGLKTLYKQMDNAVSGNKNAIASFKELGFSTKDLQTMDREQLFEETIKRLAQMPDTAERAALAQKLLGKSGLELAPLFNMQADEIDGLLKKTEEYGMVLSDDLVKDSAAFKDSMTTLDKTFSGFKNNLVGQLLPGLTQITDGFAGLIAGVDGSDAQISKGIDSLTSTFDKILPQIEGIINKVIPIILPLGQKIIGTLGSAIMTHLPELLTFAVNIITTLVNGLVQPDVLGQLLTAAVNIIITLAQGLTSAVQLLVTPAIEAIMTLVNALLDPEMITQLLTAAINIILALVDGITQALPNLIPAIINAVFLIVDTLMNNAEKLLDAALTLILTLAQGILNALPQLVEKLPAIITAVVNFLTGPALPKILQAAITLFLEIVKAIPVIVVELLKATPQIIKALIDGIGKGIEQMAVVGGQLMMGLIRGIKEGLKGVLKIVTDSANTVVNRFKSIFKVASPSKVFAEIGNFLAEGLGIGFDDGMTDTLSGMEKSASKMIDSVSDVMSSGIKDADFDTSFNVVKNSTVQHQIDYSSGLGKIEQAIMSQAQAITGQNDKQIIIPVYIGNEKLDTLIVNGIDRYNYATGGH